MWYTSENRIGKKDGFCVENIYGEKREGESNKYRQRQKVELEGKKRDCNGQKVSLTLPPRAEPLTLHEDNEFSLLNKPDPDPSHPPLLVTYFPRGLSGGETRAPNPDLSSLASQM